MIASASRQRLITFASIGLANTLIDLSIFLGLRQLLVPILLANICSTSVALSFSYLMNKRFTFKSSDQIKRSLPIFFVVTIAGLWLLQPVIIKIVLYGLNLPAIDDYLTTVLASADSYYELIAKLTATPATLLWNFIMYQKVVFKKTKQNDT